MKLKATLPIERDGAEIVTTITGNYYPCRPEVRYQRNGDPGWPGEPARIEDIEAYGPDGEYELTREEMEEAKQSLFDALAETYSATNN